MSLAKVLITFQIMSDTNILLSTNRLLLRRVEKGDQKLLDRLFCDPEMMQYLGGIWTKELVTELVKEWYDEWGKNNYWYGVIVVKASSEAIGIAGFTENTHPQELGLEFSWFIVPEHQKKGYATEITKEILLFVFEYLKKDRLFAETHPDNVAANKVLEKLCFKRLDERNYKYDYLPGFDRQVIWEYRRFDWRHS